MVPAQSVDHRQFIGRHLSVATVFLHRLHDPVSILLGSFGSQVFANDPGQLHISLCHINAPGRDQNKTASSRPQWLSDAALTELNSDWTTRVPELFLISRGVIIALVIDLHDRHDLDTSRGSSEPDQEHRIYRIPAELQSGGFLHLAVRPSRPAGQA